MSMTTLYFVLALLAVVSFVAAIPFAWRQKHYDALTFIALGLAMVAFIEVIKYGRNL